MNRISLACLLVFAAVPSAAQVRPVPRAGMAVLVREMQRGTPIIGAVVTVNLLGTTPIRRQKTTDSSGFARFDSLPPASYVVSAAGAGFDSYTWTHLIKEPKVDTLQVKLLVVVPGSASDPATCQAALARMGLPAAPDPCAALKAAGGNH